MAQVAAPSLLAAGGGAVLPSRNGTGLLRSRAIVRRPRISAKLELCGAEKGSIQHVIHWCVKCKVDVTECRYWQTAGERKGENPMMTPLPYIIIFGMSTPFVILAIAFANGWIKVPVR
ncbi:hypothetical protein ABZP36_018690 [Zizania latifolia]